MVSPDLFGQWKLHAQEIAVLWLQKGEASMRPLPGAVLDQLSLGDVSWKYVEAWIQEIVPWIPGVAGVPVLSKYPLLIDAPKGEARFLREGPVEAVLGMLYPKRRWAKLRLNWQKNMPYIDVTVGERRLTMVLDTGSTTTDLQLETVRKLGLRAAHSQQVRTARISGDQVQDLEVFSIDGMRIGNWDCKFETTPSDEPILNWMHVDGILGFDLLGQVPFVFDAIGGMLWVVDPTPGTPPMLLSTQESRAVAWCQDPFPAARAFAAASTAKTGRRGVLYLVASLLDDSVPEVRDAAASTIAFFAQQTWPEAARLEQARDWWQQHKNDPEFNQAAVH